MSNIIHKEIKRRAKVAVILGSTPNFNEYAFKYFLLSLNDLQNSYEFVFPEVDNYFYNANIYDETYLCNTFQLAKGKILFEGTPDYYVVIIKAKIDGNLFFRCVSNTSYITTDRWERLFSPPSLFEYLLHCIYASLIFMHPKMNWSSHHETRGCTLDYTKYKADDKVDIGLGYLCDSCKNEIVKSVGNDFLEDVSNVIRRKWIGDIESYDSVAYNLQRFFKFNINKDSGFNKTFWEKTTDHFPEIPKEIIVGIVSAAIAAFITLIFTHTI